MSLYEDRILPHLVNLGMRQSTFDPYRQRVVSAAEGCVLEIGVGSGLNLRYYPAQVTRLIALDRSPRLLAMARRHRAPGERSTTLLEASAETIPLHDMAVDAVVTTWTLCSIANVQASLTEMRRVLKPSGRLLFVEHGRAPEPAVQRWQNRLTPIWKRIAGGCHLNRPVSDLLEDAGFRIERLETGYMDGPKPFSFMYEGAARKE
jgi:ubiquinone/menaquinone biosynthesis C-methylase UbiE